ncbi:MAG: NADH-quinone oxidoreductase subunit N [Ignavibacteriae bacterium]|nr:NADH-quinone oxidoreductase subunit N [Ignavibacteriota bacterium]
MDLTTLWQDTLAIGPITLITLVGLLVLTIEAVSNKTETMSHWLSVIGLTAGVVLSISQIANAGTAFSGMVTTGGYAAFFATVFCVAGLLTVMMSKLYIKKEGIEHGEYYALVLFAVVGMMMMAAAADLVVLFLGLEIMSVSFYILAGFARRSPASNEAAMKYFLLGAFATGFFLYGIALMYGTSGTTNIPAIIANGNQLVTKTLFLLGCGLLLVGFVFKIAAVPFHMWVPDVYEGSPTPVSGFMSTGGKAAAFSGLLIVFAPALLQLGGPLRDVLSVIASLSMVVGNVIAISQSSIKRMLAYSSIAHAGYILVGVIAANSYGAQGVLFYLVAYTVMNVGAFGILSVLETSERTNLTFEECSGLGSRRPMLALLMAVFMFSLTGIPPFAGFFGKYYVFAGAVQAGYTWLAIVGVLMSVVSAYYYLRLVVLMYFSEGVFAVEQDMARSGFGTTALVVSAVALLGLGIYPPIILNLISYFF